MEEENSELSDRNSKYKHYQLFKKVAMHERQKLSHMMIVHGSKELHQSSYYKAMEQKNQQLVNRFLKRLIGGTALVYLFTFLLHRRRSWVLSSGGSLRSILFKYAPIWTFAFYKRWQVDISQPAFRIEGDFGQIQQQFWNLYSSGKGDLLISMQKREKQGKGIF